MPSSVQDSSEPRSSIHKRPSDTPQNREEIKRFKSNGFGAEATNGSTNRTYPLNVYRQLGNRANNQGVQREQILASNVQELEELLNNNNEGDVRREQILARNVQELEELLGNNEEPLPEINSDNDAEEALLPYTIGSPVVMSEADVNTYYVKSLKNLEKRVKNPTYTTPALNALMRRKMDPTIVWSAPAVPAEDIVQQFRRNLTIKKPANFVSTSTKIPEIEAIAQVFHTYFREKLSISSGNNNYIHIPAGIFTIHDKPNVAVTRCASYFKNLYFRWQQLCRPSPIDFVIMKISAVPTSLSNVEKRQIACSIYNNTPISERYYVIKPNEAGETDKTIVRGNTIRSWTKL